MTTPTTKTPSDDEWPAIYSPEETLAIWRSGVARWHANPWPALRGSGDTTDAHQGRCVRLLVCLHPNPSAALLAAAACHDVQECVTGDVPGAAKERPSAFGDAVWFREMEAAVEMGLPLAGGKEEWWITLVDKLDAWLWAQLVEPRAVRNDPSWRDHAAEILELAKDLGCEDTVGAMIAAMG